MLTVLRKTSTSAPHQSGDCDIGNVNSGARSVDDVQRASALRELVDAGRALSSVVAKDEVGRTCEEHAAQARDALQHVFSCKHIADVIEDVLSNEYLLERIAARSYRNVQGFLKVVLAQNEDDAEGGWKIRLHKWSRQRQCEAPHTHKWDFYSCVLRGELRQHIYIKSTLDTPSTPTADVECKPYYEREPTFSAGETMEPGCTTCRGVYCISSPTETSVQLVPAASNLLLQKGDSYYMPRDTVHAVDPQEDAVSLVFTYPFASINSKVYIVQEHGDAPRERQASNVSTRELEVELRNLASMLNNTF